MGHSVSTVFASQIISIRGHTFNMEISSTDAERSKGLMYRKYLAPLHGMLFFFSKGEEVTMWMKNTYIPLDMIFVDPQRTIACIARNTKPRSQKLLSCGNNIMAVIEINAGESEKFNIQEGDTVTDLPTTVLHLYNETDNFPRLKT
jgi:uncharacterized membrane protein (UPF0127 family)